MLHVVLVLPGARGKGGCEILDMGTRKRTVVLCERSTHL